MAIFRERGARRSVGVITLVAAFCLTAYPAPETSMQSGQAMVQADMIDPSSRIWPEPTDHGWLHLVNRASLQPALCDGLHLHDHLVAARSLQDKKPWTAADIVSGDDLSKLISSPHGAKPVILQVGIEALYRDAHIPDSIFAGPAAEPEGLALLKSQVKAIARTKEIIIYCGCCPWKDCPNIRPAFVALQQMGFKKVKLLSIPTDFQQDWVNKGFPTVRS